MNPLSLYYGVKAYVDSYAGFLGQRFLSLIWVVALCVIIWFYGSMLAFGSFQPFASERARLIAIGVIVLGWLVYMAVGYVRKRRTDRAMLDDLADDAKADADAEARAEVDTLRDRLTEALTLLRKVVGRRFGYVYELPWYLLMGAPGSGKTTSILNSGLKFPLGDALGGEPVRGVGGTRNCNWWFAEEAILIDTAGRYTTQADYKGVDKAGWNGFLGLLKRHRPSQPINGILLTLSVPDLLDRDAEERLEEIRAIRQRLAEIDETLGARVPVYVLLTKTDLLDGFVPFFDGLAKSDREQVWGMTFDLDVSREATGLPERFLAEFDLLRDRVGAMLLERLQQEPDVETRGLIFQLPAQLMRLREPIHEVLAELCSGSKFVHAPLLRGVYLTSGTQETAGAAMAPQRRGLKRSYFLSRLFSDVVFEEAALVARDRRLSRRQLIIRRLAAGAAVGAASLVLVGWTSAYVHNRAALVEAENALTQFEQLSRHIPVRDVADADFLRVLPPLDVLAQATDGFGEPGLLPVEFGLGQSDKVGAGHRQAYGRALDTLLLPRLMVHLQNELLTEDLSVSKTVDALKFYGMLGGLGPMDPDFATARAKAIFSELYPGDGRAPARAQLVRHVAALVARPFAAIDIDDKLVADARETVRGQTLPQRAYDILREDPAARALPAWSASTALGTLGEPAFVRRSGESLRTGVDGFYTREGFRRVVLPNLARVAEVAVSEGWVRGEPTPVGLAPTRVAEDTLRLYLSDFERRWRDHLADLLVRPSDDLAGMTEVTRVLAGAPPPLEALARSVAEATELRLAPAAGTSGAESGEGHAAQHFAGLLPADVATLPDPYAPLRDALERSEETPSQAAALQPLIGSLYDQLSRAASSSAEVAAIFDVDGKLNGANQALLAEARRLPAPLDRWVGELAANVDALAVKTARTSLAELWRAEGAWVCRDAIAGRYPFDRTTDRDVAMDDFVRVFGPEGLFETFFASKLAPFVDTSTTPWTWKGSFGTEGVSSDALRQFAAARTIRQAFFPSGEQPAVTLNITPVSLDTAANAVILEIEGNRVVYFHGPIRPKTIAWPARKGSSLSRVVFQPGGWDQAIARSGPWSAMRLFDLAEKTPVSDDRFLVAFDANGHEATFEVQVGSILNPFALGALSAFRCPTEL